MVETDPEIDPSTDLSYRDAPNYVSIEESWLREIARADERMNRTTDFLRKQHENPQE